MEVLLAGNTGYVTETFIEESFPECDVVVLGNEMLKSNRKKNILSRPFIKDEKELKEIFETYEFERIVYFSNYLTMHGRMTGELEQLRQILQLCKKNKEIRMLYLTGQESIYNITSGKTLLVSAAENVVMEYGNMYQINTKILRIPHLYSAVYTQDFFYKLFTEAEESGKIVFEESPEQNIYFVCMDDLAELLYKVYDNWGKERCLNVPDCFRQSFSDLEKEIRKNIRRKQNVISKWSKEEKERYLQFKAEWFNPKIRTEANIQLNLLLGYDEEANYDRISSLVGEVYEGTDFTQLELMKALQKRQMKRASISTRTTDTEELEICNRACTDHAIQRSIICFDIYNAAMSSLESMAEYYNPEDIRSEKEKLAAERKECLEDVDKTREECLESCKDTYGK